MTIYFCFSWRQRINITLKIPQSKTNYCRILIAHIVGNFYKPVLTQNIPGFPLVLLRTWDSSHLLFSFFFFPWLATARAFYLVLLVSCAQDPVQRQGALVSADRSEQWQLCCQHIFLETEVEKACPPGHAVSRENKTGRHHQNQHKMC